MQRRQGPPILQPFYDMFKLLDKRTLIVHAPHALLAVAHFFVLWFTVAAIFLGWNLLYIIFLHLFAQLLLIVAGYSVRSVYSHIGSNRELLMVVAYEPILILVAVGLYLVSGSFEVSEILKSGGYLTQLPLLFAALLMIVPIKVKKSPFDVGEAHQEIVGGSRSSTAGCFTSFCICPVFSNISLSTVLFTSSVGSRIGLGQLLVAGVFLLVNLVDNATARVRPAQMVKIIYTVAMALAVFNLAGVLL
jgi:ech hydrogenase subunit B